MNAYRYFSLVFSYPTEEGLKELRAVSDAADLPGPHSGDALGAMPLEEVQAEYTRLFISSYPALLCPPYESYYREGIVYGNTAIEVRELYEKRGLKFSFEGEPPDLLSAELDFLAITNDGSFLARMKEWVYGFTERVRENSALYGRYADELETFLKKA